MYTSVKKLVEDFKKLIDTQKPLHTMFVTYNDIEGYEDNTIINNKKGLSIVTKCKKIGSTSTVKLLPFTFPGLIQNHPEILQKINTYDPQLFKNIEMDSPQSDTQLLAVFYTNYKDIQEFLNIAKRFKQQHPTIIIILITTSYNIDQLEKALQENVITNFLKISNLYDYNGNEAMGEFITELIALWPEH